MAKGLSRAYNNRYISSNRIPDNFDKIKAYYIEGKRLSDVQEKKRLQYVEAHSLRVGGYSKEQVVRILKQNGIADNDATAYRIVNGAEVLFGDITASNKEGMRVILTENFMRVYNFASLREDMKEANRALENIAKINNLFKEDDPVNWDKIFIPIPVYTTNPQVLKIGQPIEDIEPEIITTN